MTVVLGDRLQVWLPASHSSLSKDFDYIRIERTEGHRLFSLCQRSLNLEDWYNVRASLLLVLNAPLLSLDHAHDYGTLTQYR
jgi:hypothetical protein